MRTRRAGGVGAMCLGLGDSNRRAGVKRRGQESLSSLRLNDQRRGQRIHYGHRVPQQWAAVTGEQRAESVARGYAPELWFCCNGSWSRGLSSHPMEEPDGVFLRRRLTGKEANYGSSARWWRQDGHVLITKRPKEADRSRHEPSGTCAAGTPSCLAFDVITSYKSMNAGCMLEKHDAYCRASESAEQ
ncbi:hypothetical protein EVAR_47999_1 [Eumeta japonica]|uniref:Uncharacterized protein n=1 Tax=Eumeta variegata TaxID=151549 RepID=A0A4C1XQG2_EUMVA|nr:hypothetical protein EVAR_47999_1 [Eumeta japonica]